MNPQSLFDPSETKISSSAISIPAIAIIDLRDLAPQEIAALFVAVAAKGLAHGKLIHRRLHCRHRGRRQRLGHVADSAADQPFCGLGIRFAKLFHPPPDLGKKVTRLELEIIFVQVGHRSSWIFRRSRRYATGRGRAVNFRFTSRTTRRRADQVSSTAQTFVSTRPSGSAHSRTTSSVTVVGTPALFFGHETQSMASSRIFLRNTGRSFASARVPCRNNESVAASPSPCKNEPRSAMARAAPDNSTAPRSPRRRILLDPQFLRQRLTGITSHDAAYHTTRCFRRWRGGRSR